MELLIIIISIIIIVMLQNFLYKQYGLKDVKYKCYFSSDIVNEGETLEFTEEISNLKLLPLPSVKAELTTSKWLDFAQSESNITDQTRFISSCFILKSYGSVKRIWKVRCLKRGVWKIDNAVLVASDLLGFVQLSRCPDTSLPSLTVLPTRYKYSESLDDIVRNHALGMLDYYSSIYEDPYSLVSTREYTGNEPLRSINWNAYAKQQKIAVNTYDGTIFKKTAVILNINGANEKLIEHTIRVCAETSCRLIEQNIPVKLICSAALQNTLVSTGKIDCTDTNLLLFLLAGINLNNSVPLKILINACSDLYDYNFIFITPELDTNIKRFKEENKSTTLILTVKQDIGELTDTIVIPLPKENNNEQIS